MFRILMVDDTRSVHSFVKSLVAKIHNISFVSAANGQEALEILKKGEKFDLILLDWEMPVLNGPDSMEAFKKAGNQVPVIMMTTRNKPEEIERMLTAGVAEYLMKPFTKDILLEKINFVSGKDFSDAA